MTDCLSALLTNTLCLFYGRRLVYPTSALCLWPSDQGHVYLTGALCIWPGPWCIWSASCACDLTRAQGLWLSDRRHVYLAATPCLCLSDRRGVLSLCLTVWPAPRACWPSDRHPVVSQRRRRSCCSPWWRWSGWPSPGSSTPLSPPTRQAGGWIRTSGRWTTRSGWTSCRRTLRTRGRQSSAKLGVKLWADCYGCLICVP